MKVAIVKYNSGNTASVVNALARIGVGAVITSERAVLASADRVIFPGVGEASTAMNYLRQTGLDHTIRSLRQPFLGICLGMQLLCSSSEENSAECLGIFPERVRRFDPDATLKVPHIGWNDLRRLSSPIFEGIDDGSYAYFVHSYYVEHGPASIASARHGTRFCAALGRDNFYGVQFHPEKSGPMGSKVLENFLNL